MKWLSILAALVFAFPVLAGELPAFRVQEIDKTLKVGYGLRIVDLNADDKLDVVVADSARVIWFDQSRAWKLRTIIDNAKAGVKPDNVCLAVRDLDGDGKQDVVLGADWQPNNTRTGGSLQWLRQGKTPDDEWTVHKIAESIPTLHRVHFLDAALVVVPLKGERSTPDRGWAVVPVRMLAYDVPADPTGKWEPRVLNDQLHVMHNVRPLGHGLLLTASSEGVGELNRKWKLTGAGNQDNPEAGRGSGEVAPGAQHHQLRFVAAIEPMHGHEVAIYTVPGNKRTVIDDQLKAGHALWCADLDDDGLHEVVAGFREPTDKGIGPGINLYKSSRADDGPMTWTKHVLDDKGIACEDLACADLDADGDVDIVACGRATQNVRIYWNQRVNPG
jgi:aldos-2-ulose dehydratase/isomerase family protein